MRCKEYTEFLIKEDKEKSLLKRIEAIFHYCICKACRLFRKQNAQFDNHLKNVKAKMKEQPLYKLDDAVKEKITQQIKKITGSE